MACDSASRESNLDILLIDPDEQRSLHIAQELAASFEVRIAEKTSAREALGSFTRARFDAVIVRQDLGDTDCWRLIRMIRSGRFGFAATPVFVFCSRAERAALLPLLDADTQLLLEGEVSALRDALLGLHDGRGRRAVLVIEDEPEAARAAVAALEKYYRAEAAGSGEDGLARWWGRRHDLVLLDLRLPGIPGHEVLRRMLLEEPGQPVIVLTAYDAIDQHRDLMLAGAVDFLSKPVDLHVLPEICAMALRNSAVLSNADRSAACEEAMDELVGRVRAAQYTLERGRTAHAAQHLRMAVFESRS